MIERHQDYSITIASLPDGDSVFSYPLPLENDAPFLARGRGIHIRPNLETRAQTAVNGLRFRFKNGAGTYTAQQPLQTPQDFWGALGQNANYRPIRPQQPYAPGSVIEFDLINESGEDLFDVQVIFRGVKLFRPGAFPDYTYPANMRALDFTYTTGKGTQQDPAIVLNTVGQLLQQPLNIRNDADFVLRAAQAGNWARDTGGVYSTVGYTNLKILLMDQNLKPYSNEPLPIDWVLGNSSGLSSPALPGPAAPGTFFPEIYLPKNSILLYNLYRDDTLFVAVTDALPVRLAMAWIGSKVYAV